MAIMGNPLFVEATLAGPSAPPAEVEIEIEATPTKAEVTPTETKTKRVDHSDKEWEYIIKRIRDAEKLVEEAREAKRLADVEYGRTTAAAAALLEIRDRMIITDPRSSAELGRLLGVTRTRCAQIRNR